MEITFELFLTNASKKGFYETGYEDLVELLDKQINREDIEHFYAKNLFLEKPLSDVELYLFETNNFIKVNFYDDYSVRLKTIPYSQIKSVELTMKLREPSSLTIYLLNDETLFFNSAYDGGTRKTAYSQSLQEIYKFLS